MADEKFELVSSYQPTGDQPQAIETLVEGVQRGDRCQTLLGVTGSGKTFTMANVIARCNRPTLVLAHNKTLAAQLCTEFRSFFPNNAVEYFVSYYDYYQPEAYIASTDTYIEKDSAINEEIEKQYAENPYKMSPETREMYKSVGGTPFLDGDYTVFGEIVEGMDVLEKIALVATDSNDRPKEDVIILGTKLKRK